MNYSINVTTFLANLKHDIRNNQSVKVGSGIFKGQELVDVAHALAATPELLAALEYVLPLAEKNVETSFGKDAIHIARAAIAKAKGEASC